MQQQGQAPASPFVLLDREEAALRMSMSLRQLDRLIRDGVIPVWRPPESPRIVKIPWWLIIDRISRENGVELQYAPDAALMERLKH